MNSVRRVLCHFVLLLDVATLLVEGNVGIIAVQNGLVTAIALTDVCECLDDTHAKLLALLAFIDGDVFDMTDASETTEKLAFNEGGAYCDDLVARLVEDDDGVVGTRGCAHGVELIDPGCLTEIIDDGKDR